MSRIREKFEELKEKGKAALVIYLTAGDPSLEVTADIIFELENNGADIIELGVPFSDPMADGPTIQLSSERALKNGTTLTGVLDILRKIRKKSEIPVIIFGYFNPFLSYGLKKFAEDAHHAGADGVLVVDLPPEEADEFKIYTDEAGLDLVFLLAPTSTSERIKIVSERARGFVYLVSITGVTGERPTMDYSLESLVRTIKNHTRLPVGIGFGVSTPDQTQKIANFADAVIVGSAFIRIIEKYGHNGKQLFKEISAFIKLLSQACKKTAIHN
jgi:tryptophan synthase alpha chain